MRAAQDDQVVRYLDELMALVARATPGMLRVEPTANRRYALRTSSGRLVGVLNRRPDAELFARDRLDLRALVIGVAEVYGRHHDDGSGHCAQDGEPVPCSTRRELRMQLASRTESA